MAVIDFGFLQDLLLAIALSFWLYWLWTRRSLYLFSWRFPGYMGLPIFGILHSLRSITRVLRVVGGYFEESKSNSICVWVGLYPAVLTKDPVLIKKILTSTELLNKANTFYKPIYSLLEGGLISSPESEWRNKRRLINPSFGNEVILSFIPIFNKAKNLACLKFDKMVDGDEHKVGNMLTRLSLGITVETTLGKKMTEGEEVDENLAEKFGFVVRQMSNRVILSALNLDGLYRFYKRYHQYRQYLKNLIDQLVMEKIERNQNGQETIDQSGKEGAISIKKTPLIFIDQGIQLYHRKQFSWHDIFSESYTMMGAAFETTASTVLSTLIMLAMHPEVQDRLYHELLQVFPRKTFDVEYDHFEQLPYLEMVINETLRLAPSVPIVGRQVVRDTQVGEHLFPKDMQILISIFHLHRCKDVWGPQAEKFDPDNFLPDRLAEKHSHAYMPFSKGIRNCIGWRYALMAVKVLVIGLIRNYRLTTNFKYEDLYFTENTALSYLVEPAFKIEHRLE